MTPGLVMVDWSVNCVGKPSQTVVDVKSGTISIRLNVTVSYLTTPPGKLPCAIIVCWPLTPSGYETNVFQLVAFTIVALVGEPVKLPVSTTLLGCDVDVPVTW